MLADSLSLPSTEGDVLHQLEKCEASHLFTKPSPPLELPRAACRAVYIQHTQGLGWLPTRRAPAGPQQPACCCESTGFTATSDTAFWSWNLGIFHCECLKHCISLSERPGEALPAEVSQKVQASSGIAGLVTAKWVLFSLRALLGNKVFCASLCKETHVNKTGSLAELMKIPDKNTQ